MIIITTIKRAAAGTLAAALGLSAVLAFAVPAQAQSVPGAPGVADVSLVQGNVVIVRGDSGAQVGASINTPLLPGDYITTAGASRAEVQLDGTSVLRLAQDTQVRFVNLQPGSREMQLASGTAELAELQGADGGPQIDTPSVSVRPNQTGDYRVSVLSNGQTLVTVRSGAATVTSGNGSQNLTPGSTLVAYGSYNAPSMNLQGAIAYDAFDQFNEQRDQAIVASYNANPYIAPALSGYADFANYGQWYNVPGYGQSWAPSNQGSNWSPYSNGQWVWEPGYGYTWVGNEPWGYVPYHYGNWYYATGYNQWMWQPPAYQYQSNTNALASSWLPALVAFFLTGGNPGAALGAYNTSSPYGYGNVGWVPLAPGEQYTPWYAGFGGNAAFPQTQLSPVTNVTNIYNVYRNIRYIKVIRVVSVNRFRKGDFRHYVAMPMSRAIARAAIVRGGIPIVPANAAVGSARPRTRIALSPRFRQPVFAAKQPVYAHAASFDRQMTMMKARVVAKPVMVPLPRRAAVTQHPVYRAPVLHRTYHAPKQVTKPVTVHHAAPAAPVHRTKPQTFVPPSQRQGMPAAPVHHTAAPVHHAAAPAPVRHAAAPAAPVHHAVAPAPVHHAAAPMHTPTPAFVPPSHRAAAPERPITPPHTAFPQRYPVRPVRTAEPMPAAPHHVAPQHVAPQHVAPQHVVPQHVAPQHVAPPHVAPQHPAPPQPKGQSPAPAKHKKATPPPA
jgi:hypothetical protein